MVAPPYSTIPLPLGGRCFNDQVRTKVVETLRPHRAHIITKLVHNHLHHLPHTLRTPVRQSPEYRAPDHHCAGPQGERFDDMVTRTYA